jgi:hypothetical protein
MFEQLKVYKEVHGNCTVQNLYVCDDGTRLGYWVAEQHKMRVKDAEMRAQRRQALDAIGFVWVVNERMRNSPRSQVEYMPVQRIASMRDEMSCSRDSRNTRQNMATVWLL